MASDITVPSTGQSWSRWRALPERLERRWWPWLALEIPLLGLAGWRSFDSIFYDTVAYLRIARYYAEGRLDLAINGYWGPLMSWLMAPLLVLTPGHLLAVRLVMGATGLLFFVAALGLLRRLALPPLGAVVAAALLVPFTVCWSVALATPDLLMGGLMLLGLGLTLAPTPDGAGRRPFVAGLAYGTAYLAKSVALPTTVLLLGLIGATRWLDGAAAPRALVRAGLASVAGLAVVAAPWVVILSLHYGAPTFSTSAAIAHAIVGPDNPDRAHPLHHMFRAPEPGRITTWEDPTEMPYPYWSPLRSGAALRYQLTLIVDNGFEAVRRVAGFDWLGIGVVSAIVAFGLRTGEPSALRDQPWRLAAPVLVAVIAPYLPTFPSATRYYLVAYPLLLAAALGFLLHDVIEPAPFGPTRARRLAAVTLIGLCAIVGLRHELIGALIGDTDPAYRIARRLAPLLRDAGPTGSLVSVDDQSVGYFTAFLLDWPFDGEKIPTAHLDDVVASGARFLITRPSTPFGQALERDEPAALERVATGTLPVAVYRIK